MRLSASKSSASSFYSGLGEQLYDLSGARPALDLNFASNGSLVDSVSGKSLVTFTRASSGTYVDGDGVIQTAGNNVARFDHNPTTGESLGLLVEESRTNLITYSEDFSDSSWNNTNIAFTATSETTDPAGQTNAYKIDPSAAPSSSYSIFNSSSVTGSFSVFFKEGSERYAVIIRGTYASGDYAIFDLQTGVVTQTPTFTGSTATITNVGNGWYRCTVVSAQSTGVNAFTVSGAGTGTTTASSGFVYIYGAQLEAGSFPTSYIRTEGSTATRSADVASITGTNFSSWYNQTEGTVFSEANFTNTVSYNTVFNITDGTSSERIRTIQWNDESSNRILSYTSSGVNQANFVGTAVTGKTRNIGAYKVNDFAAVQDGGSAQTDTSGSISTSVNSIDLGSTSGTFVLNGHISRLTYWPTRLSNDTLQTITR